MTTESHIPVLLNEVLGFYQNSEVKSIYLDATFGRGGHAQAILEEGFVKVCCLMDRDPDAIGVANQMMKPWIENGVQVHIEHASYHEMNSFLESKSISKFDFILLDLGVSSPQLDDCERGFSFLRPGPLDMRLDHSQGKTAADILFELSEEELADVIFQYGEERHSRKIAKAIVEQRKIFPIKDTSTLAQLVESIIPKKEKIHPATRTFQALRIYVNRELEFLEKSLELIPSLLSPMGRVVMISFHSLEDRLVKHAFKKWQKEKLGKVLTKKCIVAEEHEVRQNRRSRSAKLRCFEKSEA